MRDEERKFGRELGWIIGLGLVAVLAGSLYDIGPYSDCTNAANMDPIDCIVGIYAAN
jgi:hypothetical protein